MKPLASTLRPLANALERAGIPYVVGGSMASSARGVIRSTFDIDIVAIVAPGMAERLAHELGPEWYADPQQMRDAIAAHRAFNVIHVPFGVKVDIFPATDDFHFEQLERATKVALTFLDDSALYPVATAEDILLAKLRWFREGGGVSERQWNDIAGILSANRGIDLNYLRLWAERLRVVDLLEKALAEAAE